MCHYDYRFLCLILLTAKIYYRLYPCPDKLEHAYASVVLKETFVTTTSYEHNWREIRYIKNGRHALIAIHWNFYLSVFLKNPFLTVENVSKFFFFLDGDYTYHKPKRGETHQELHNEKHINGALLGRNPSCFASFLNFSSVLYLSDWFSISRFNNVVKFTPGRIMESKLYDLENNSWLIGRKLIECKKPPKLLEPLSESNLKTFRKLQNITKTGQMDH